MNRICKECDWEGDDSELVDPEGRTWNDDNCVLENALFCPRCHYRILETDPEAPKDLEDAFDLDKVSDPDVEENFDSLGQD